MLWSCLLPQWQPVYLMAADLVQQLLPCSQRHLLCSCCLQALGVAVELSPASVAACIEQTNLGFMYAPYYHPVMKSVKAVRSALQVCKSVFSVTNINCCGSCVSSSLYRADQPRLHVRPVLPPSQEVSQSCEVSSPGIYFKSQCQQ